MRKTASEQMAWRCLEVTCPGDQLVNGKALDRFVRLRVDRAERFAIDRASFVRLHRSKRDRVSGPAKGRAKWDAGKRAPGGGGGGGGQTPSVLNAQRRRHDDSIWREREYLHVKGECVAPSCAWTRRHHSFDRRLFRRRPGRARCPQIMGGQITASVRAKYLAARNCHINLPRIGDSH